MTEKITRLLNESARPGSSGEFAYSHHGSLSRELRAVVEQRLKEGRLRAIVATNSLELGIDIGSLDEVLLVQAPPTIASAVQRIGRAGHAVGQTAKARLYPFQGRDLVQAAVIARCVFEHAGLGLEALKGTLPARKPSNHLVFHGSRPVVVSRGNGGRLEIAVAPDHPDLERYLGFLKNLLSRQDQPLRAIDLSEINGGPAADSAYAATFRKLFQATPEGASLRLRRRYVAGGEVG